MPRRRSDGAQRHSRSNECLQRQIAKLILRMNTGDVPLTLASNNVNVGVSAERQEGSHVRFCFLPAESPTLL